MLIHVARISPSRAHLFIATARMLSATKLSEQQTADAILKLNAGAAAPPGAGFGWEKELTGRDAIQKSYRFTDFKQAWQWMSKVAVLAEDMNHHPEWFNVYNIVEVKLTTHDSKGVSSLDIEMATKMDEYAEEIMPTRKMTKAKKVP